MEFRQLQAFRAAALNKGFTRASEQLHLSQSSISLHIKHLEEELGCTLFLRVGKRVRLSGTGRLLLSYTDKIFRDLKNAEIAVRKLNSAPRGSVRLGTGAATLIYRLAPVLAAYRKDFPGVELFVESGTTEFMVGQIKNRRLDLAIAQLPLAERAIEITPLGREELIIIIPRLSRAAKEYELEPADLAQMPFTLYKRRTAMQSLIEDYWGKLGIEVRVTMRMDNPEAIKSVVSSGLSASIVPASAISGAARRGAIRPVRVKGHPLFRELILLAPQIGPPPDAVVEMKKYLVDALSGTVTADIPSRFQKPANSEFNASDSLSASLSPPA